MSWTLTLIVSAFAITTAILICRIMKYEEDTKELESDLDRRTDANDALAKRLEDANKQIAELKERIAGFDGMAMVDKQTWEEVESRATAATAKVGQLVPRVKALDSQLETANQSLSVLRSDLKEAANMNQELRSELANSERVLLDKCKKIAELENTLAEHRSSMRTMKRSYESRGR